MYIFFFLITLLLLNEFITNGQKMVIQKNTIRNILNGTQPKAPKLNKKSIYKLSRSQRYRVLTQIKNNLKISLKDIDTQLNNYGCTFGKIPIVKLDEIENLSGTSFQPQVELFEKTQQDFNVENNEYTQSISNLKDEILLSDKNYTKLQKKTNNMLPTIYRVRKARLTLNNTLFKVYRNRFGNYVNGESKIRFMIKKYLKTLNIKDNVIRVKLCGDGTNCGKLKLFNFCFTLPDQGKVAKTAFGNFSLGVFEIKKENYTTLKWCLRELVNNLRNFAKNNEIEIDGVKFKVKFLLTGDMKFLHAVMGLNACNSKHSCIWCKHQTSDFYKLDLISKNPLMRSLNEQIEISKNLDVEETIDGQQNIPIFDFIELEDVVFDTLHLLLRIAGKLVLLKFRELVAIDGISSIDIEELPYQKRFFEYLSEIGVSEPYTYVKSENDSGNNMKLKIRTLNGDDCLKILKNMNFNECFPESLFPKFQERTSSTDMFKNFYKIFMQLKQKFYNDNIDLLKQETKDWLTSFTKEHATKHVTPYIHLFSSHLCFFVELHGDVDIFNISGLEKLNDLTTNQTFNQSNLKPFYCYQIMCAKNRLESFRNFEQKTVKINKKVESQIKIFRKDIREIESKKLWCEYKINKNPINNLEIRNFGTENFSINLMESAMEVLKTNSTLVLGSNVIKHLFEGDFKSITNEIQFLRYEFISGLLNLGSKLYLIFVDCEKKTIYFIDLLKENSKLASKFQEAWIKFLKERHLFNDSKWKLEKFKHSQIENFKSYDVAILMVFNSLIKKKSKLLKFCEKNLNNFKNDIIFKLKENSDVSSFCSSCSQSFEDVLDNCFYECQCTRKFHKNCLDKRYEKIYKYENFTCIFCYQK